MKKDFEVLERTEKAIVIKTKTGKIHVLNRDIDDKQSNRRC